MRFPKRLLTIAAAVTALSSVASGYYHFVYFSGSGPYLPINLKFNLSSLQNNTVYYFISDQGPNVFVPGDSFTAEISELQLAAQAWNNVSSSQIKLAYGGLENSATQQSTATPAIDIVFSDNNIAEGILAQTKVTTLADVSFIGANPPTSLPIIRSTIQFRQNLTVTSPQQASFYDSSFTTMVHEFGHSLGLQHTLTSATMSTYITRSTTKSMPLAADDIAGISLLYPSAGYLASTGSIQGQVVLNGNGVNLASVVALSLSTGAAISNLTNPDGTWEIDGIPPGNYIVYVHPLPPAAEGEAGPDAIVLPQNSTFTAYPAFTGFVTQFYSPNFPGTRDWTQAATVAVTAANISTGINFSVQQSAGPQVYAMELAGLVNNATEYNPMLLAGGTFSMDFTAPGTVVNNNQLAPGFNLAVIGNPATAAAEVIPGYTQYYENGYISLGMWAFTVPFTTPVPLALNVASDIYIQPAAFYVVSNPAPVISNLTPGTDSNGKPNLTVAGSNLSSATEIVFDGAPATLISANSDGSLTVHVPAAAGPYTSSIEALNPDGQTSGQVNPFGPPQSVYTYGYTNPAVISEVSPASVVPGTDAWIQINGSNTNFNPQTQVGFGSSDIVVLQTWVVSPTTLWVNVAVNTSAPTSNTTTVTVTTGLQTATSSPFLGTGPGLQIASGNQISLLAPVTNAATGLGGVPVGGTAVINTIALPPTVTGAGSPGWSLTIGNEQTSWVVSQTNQITAVVPPGVSGANLVTLTTPTGASSSIVMWVDMPPPQIGLILNQSGTAVSSTTQVHPGDSLIVNISNFGDNITPITLGNIFATIDATNGATNGLGGINAPVNALAPNDSSIEIQIPASAPNNAATPLTVGIGTRVSAPVYLNIHN